jgi:hypothetical protein
MPVTRGTEMSHSPRRRLRHPLDGHIPPVVLISACTGDCAGISTVTVDKILTMVNIALGNAPLFARSIVLIACSAPKPEWKRLALVSRDPHFAAYGVPVLW